MTSEELVSRLEAVRPSSRGYLARCPAHADNSPSLSVLDGERGILLKCWAGCRLEDICTALGIRQTELFFDAPAPRGHLRIAPKQITNDPRSIAFRFELGALDRRLRADQILTATQNINGDALTDAVRNRLMKAVASAYRDLERADFFERVSDTIRWRAWRSREGGRHAA